MSDSFIMGMKHSHTLFVVLFTVHYLFKSILFFSGKNELLSKYQNRAKILMDIVAPTLFIITGIIMIVHIGMSNIGGWFHLKLTILIVLIPLAIIGFRKKNKVLIASSCIFFVYLILLAFLKKPLLFF